MPKNGKNHNKKKKKRNRKHKPQHKSKSSHSPKPKRGKPNANRIKEVKQIKVLPKESHSSGSTSHADTHIHSPIKLHYYDADVSDSDTPNSPSKQIIRSAKISHRDGLTRAHSNPSIISPGFDRDHAPSLITQHQFSPIMPSNLHRASSEPLSSSCSPRFSILRSPSRSPSHNTSHSHSVSFGSVEVHEFSLLAGSESDGVPEDGALSLHLSPNEIRRETLNINTYESKRYQRWTQRAKDLHWNNKKLNKAMVNPERYLFTAGRCDEFYSSLTPREREQRLEIDKEWKKEHVTELNEERSELNKLRKSRKTNDIFCTCKPLKAMSTAELKDIAKQYDITIHANRKVKKGFLINQLKAKVLNYRDVCCWDKWSCSCVANGIDCHSGTKERNFQCGCVKSHKKCINPQGCYVYKEPHYATSLIDEWKQYYRNDVTKKEKNQAPRVSFELC